MRTHVIIQARMGSTRLPGKVLMPLGGKPALPRLIERVSAATTVDGIVLATSGLPSDDPSAAYCTENGLPCVRGSESDVLARYLLALEAHPSEIVVRITGDCPLMDPAIIDRLVTTLREHPSAPDYHSNTIAPRMIPHGLDVEIFRAEALRRAGREAIAPEEREHVTPYIYRNPQIFTILRANHPEDISHHRWTLDTPEDYRFLDKVLSALAPGAFSWRDTLEVLEKNPEWTAINATVTQKKLDQGK